MQKTLGMKFDSEKPRMGLLPPLALESVAEVLTFGAKKYLPNNWKHVENGHQRYIDAALRHITAHMKGEQTDPETNIHHLSHAICCLMFIVDLDLAEFKSNTDSPTFSAKIISPEAITGYDVLNQHINQMIKETQ